MRGFLLLVVLSMLALPVGAAIVYSQPHTGSGALLISSRYQSNGLNYDQWVWDSFTLPTAQALTEIRWRGGHNPEMAYWGGDILNFRVSIYESTPGLSQPLLGAQYPATPATLVAYDTGDRAGETSVGMFGGVELFDYHFVLPTVFQVQAGKQYWVQIEAEQGNGLPDWGLATGTGTGSYFRRLSGGSDLVFQSLSGDAAFSLVASDGPTYTVAASVTPAGSGTTTGEGLYPDGASAPLVATPNAGYGFVSWTDGGTVVSTAASYTFAVTGDRTLVANFAPGSVITTASSPLLGGTTDGGGSVVNGRSVTVEAVAAANYTFVHWTENDVPVSSSAFYTFTVGADRDLVAQFAPTATNLGIVFSQPPTNSATLLPSAYLSPDGIDGMHYSFEKYITATTEDITDVRWRGGYDPALSVASNPVTEFVITFYASYDMNGFNPDLANVLRKVTVSDNAGETFAGTIGAVQLYDYHVTLPNSVHAVAGTPYWIQIEAWQGGYPLNWGVATASGGNGMHFRRTGNSYFNRAGDLAVTLSADVTTTYTITASPADPAGGSVSGEGLYALDAVVPLLATPKTGYALANWTENGVIVTNAAAYAFPAHADRTLVAHFAPTRSVNLSSSSLTMGTVAGAGAYLLGSTATAAATAKPGYVFVKWTESGTSVSKLAPYTFSVVSNRTLVANFAVGYTVAASALPSGGGSVSGAGGYATGSSATLLATPAQGYVFAGWTEGAATVSTAPSYAFSVGANRVLTANFALIIPQMELAASPPGELLLSWPASLPGWVLQECPDLKGGVWTNSARSSTVSGTQRHVTITPPTDQSFFRLSHP